MSTVPQDALSKLEIIKEMSVNADVQQLTKVIIDYIKYVDKKEKKSKDNKVMGFSK